MRASTILAGALALARTAYAVPAGSDTDDYWSREEMMPRDGIVPRDGQAADATMPWVGVNDEGQPIETHTPSPTTDENGATSVADGAPHDLTASVYTMTSYGVVTTSTGDPPNPTATSKGGEGAFSRCYNVDGEFAPFCKPSHNTTLLTGNTYYGELFSSISVPVSCHRRNADLFTVTWDPDYYNTSTPSDNTTYEVALRVDYLNLTTNEWLKLETYDRVPASWGFWPFKVEKKHLKGHHKINNITLTLLSSPKGTNEKNASIAMPAAIGAPTLPANQPTKTPDHRDLIIALPVTFGSLALILFGVCLWNRKTRRIQLRDVMSRARRRTGYTGRSTRRMWRKDNGIQLSSRVEPPTPDYTDDLEPPHPHRDSDDLGSLAGSPVNTSFQNKGTTGGRNAFRDEVERQRVQRQEDDHFF